MKIHTKKKLYRLSLKQAAKEGYINDADGKLIRRGQARDGSMKRDFYPQTA